MGRIQIPVSLGGANHLSITLICPPATDNKILLSTLINISPALITRNPRSRKKENKCLARYQTYVTTRIEEFRGKRKKGSAVFRVDLLYEEGSRKRPWRRKKFLGMQRYIPPDPFAFESRMRGVFIEGHVSLPTSLALSPTLGGILQPPPSCFFSSRDTSRGFPFAVPPPFTQGWIRFRRMKSPGGLDFATHRSLHIYIYIRIVHSRIPLSPQ